VTTLTTSSRWAEYHLDFLRQFSPFHHEIPCLLLPFSAGRRSRQQVAENEKGHGRIEMRTCTASSKVDWIVSERSYPGEPRFTNIKTLVKVYSRIEYADQCSFETRYYISSAAQR